MPSPSVLCAGGVVADRKLHLLAPAVPATSNPARGAMAAGGVARNVAENLARLGVGVALVSRVGDDEAGRSLRAQLVALGVDVSRVGVVPGASTAQYVAVLDPGGDLVIGAADMAVLDAVPAADVDAGWPEVGLVLADCNLPAPVLAHVLARGRDDGVAGGVEVAVDAVSAPKVARLPTDLSGVGVLFCNRDEARALLVRCGRDAGGHDAALARQLRLAGARRVVLTRAAAGVLLADAAGERELPAVPARPVDVTGAGDALVAGTLAGLLAGRHLDDAARLGILVAALTVESEHSVRPDLSPEVVAAERARRATAQLPSTTESRPG